MNVYEIVTDKILAELEKGVIPWQKPWTGVREGAISHVTGRPYSLLNQMLLGKPGEWLTYKQAEQRGGKVKEDERKKSSIVVFWKWLEKEEEKDGKKIKKSIPYLRYYSVYHISQCEGVEERFPEKKLEHTDPIADAEAVLDGYVERSGVKFMAEKSNRAYYSPMLDEIHVPILDQFDKPEEYYSTVFHEATHSTGHKDRLDRLDMTAHFGSEEYSKEELVAEIGAATLCNTVGIETENSFKNSAAYVGGWLKALKNDKRLIVTAAGKAEKAVKYILGEEVKAYETVDE